MTTRIGQFGSMSDAAPPRSGVSGMKRSRQNAANGGVGSFSSGPARGSSRYMRGATDAKIAAATTDVKLKARIKRTEATFRAAADAAARSELLLTEEPGALEAEGAMERTWRMPQSALRAGVSSGVARRAASLDLDAYGPYAGAWSRDGRHMLLTGGAGHVAVLDWGAGVGAAPRAATEFHVRESVRAAVWLEHSDGLFALAQRRYAYIYDGSGAEVHKLTHHVQPRALEYLPYHFLLASLGHAGWLKYQDVSTGKLVAEHNTRAAHTAVLRANPWNAVLCAGQTDGAVSMWTPNMPTAVAKILAHRGPVTALAIDGGGRYMVTAGGDARLKVWDIRKFQDDPLFSYFTPVPATTLDISGRGFVAVGAGSHVQIWGRDFATELAPGLVTAPLDFSALTARAASTEAPAPRPATAGGSAFPPGRRPTPILPPKVSKARAPYLKHELPGNLVHSLRFRPFDDLLACGHERGLMSLIVPGAGEPNPDSREADPLLTKKGRREAQVHALLDKLAPGMITMDPTRVGAVDTAAPAVREAERKEDEAAAAAAAAAAKTGGKAKRRRIKKKNKNIVTAARAAQQEKNMARLLAKKERKAAEAERIAAGGEVEAPPAAAGLGALARFFPPKHSK